MKKKTLSKQQNPLLSNPILEEFENFKVRRSSLIGQDERENEERSKPNDSEYPTVRYEISMNRKKRRLLLQTLLDRIFLRENFYLYFAEYIILEDLYFSIIEKDSKEGLKDQDIRHYAEMLMLVKWILKNLQIKSKLEDRKGTGYSKEDVQRTMEKEFLFFRISTSREYGSRVSTYYPEKIISFTVGITLISREKNKPSIPYSSYTKGYGESHPKKLQTPRDYEIDGEDIWNFDESQRLEPIIDLIIQRDEEQTDE